MDAIGAFGRWFFGALYDNRIPIAIGGVLALVVLAVVARRRGWVTSARRHPGRTAAVAIPALVVAIPLAWYMASPLVLSSTIDEPAPSVVAARPSPSATTPSPSPADTARPSTGPAPSVSPAELISLAGPFHGSDDFHFGRGTARLIETAPGVFVIRLEDFEVRNGPDLYVYLSPSADGYTDGAIEVAKLKADKGNQNYDVPAGAFTGGKRPASVVIWCKQFSHLFATAPLS
jgi:hypothetical protein